MRRFIEMFSALLLCGLTASPASAQAIPAGTFKHIIIVIQENRTPDNLFGAGPSKPGSCNSEDPFEPGVDIEAGGYGYVAISSTLNERELICDTPLPLSAYDAGISQPLDPDHTFIGWGLDYHNGNMDGFCHEYDNANYIGVCPTYSCAEIGRAALL